MCGVYCLPLCLGVCVQSFFIFGINGIFFGVAIYYAVVFFLGFLFFNYISSKPHMRKLKYFLYLYLVYYNIYRYLWAAGTRIYLVTLFVVFHTMWRPLYGPHVYVINCLEILAFSIYTILLGKKICTILRLCIQYANLPGSPQDLNNNLTIILCISLYYYIS